MFLNILNAYNWIFKILIGAINGTLTPHESMNISNQCSELFITVMKQQRQQSMYHQ